MSPRLRFAIVLLVAFAAAGTGVLAQAAFSDQTYNAELYHFTGVYLDTASGAFYPGGSVGDFNRDGWPDLFLLGGGNLEDGLYINDGDGTFTDEAQAWGLGGEHRGRGTTVGDFNADGWPDIFVTSGGDLTAPDRVGQHRLYRNNGNGTFTDIAVSAGVNMASPTNRTASGAAFGDYDLDGDLDLFVCTWEGFDGNRLYRNNGDETFTDVTVAAGIVQDFWGFSPRFVDMNGDRYPELLIAADFVTSRYFVNDGDGTFTDESALSGTGVETNGMGQTVADFNRDGLPDWFVTSIYEVGSAVAGNFLYVNQGDDQYTYLPETDPSRDGGWGWGTEAVDFDHDGFVDIAETNGWRNPQFESVSSMLYRNNGDMTFTEVHESVGIDHVTQGRTVLTLDYDRDGDMDLVFTSLDNDVALYRNDLTGPETHWIEIMLDTSGHPGLAPDGYGAKVVVTAGGVTQSWWISGGTSYLGRSQPVAHFGLGSATTVDSLTVEWPDGTTTVQTAVAADQILTIVPAGGTGGAPGEASGNAGSPMRASHDPGSGNIDVTYTAACDATEHTIYYGNLADVSTHGYSGAECGVGTSGSASFDPGPGDFFFVVVGTNATDEGSYGLDGSGSERPEDIATTGCDRPQDLSGTCDLP